MTPLIQPLPDGPLDIIGDVHGEFDALCALLERLGCDLKRTTSPRTLVFVGDLIDRGPDSPAVVQLVRRFVDAGRAQCVLGNHEVNLLLEEEKEGNGWARNDPMDHFQWSTPTGIEDVPFPSKLASRDEVGQFRDFFSTLPLALVGADLRVAHACWHAPSLAALPDSANIISLARSITHTIETDLKQSGIAAREQEELNAYARLRRLDVKPNRPLPAHTTAAQRRQGEHPVKVITSGLEVPHSFSQLRFLGGKWRFLSRDSWWERYTDTQAVVVGHYWRQRSAQKDAGKPDAWKTTHFADWTGPHGNVFCVDYSVGRRYRERVRGKTTNFTGGLAALRWPERTLQFDDQDSVMPTSGWQR